MITTISKPTTVIGFTDDQIAANAKMLDQGLVMFDDNAIARGILAQEGLLDLLIHDGKPFGHAVGFAVTTDRTCWIVGVYDDYHPLPIDNGFTVFMLRRDDWTDEKAMEFAERVREITRSHDPKVIEKCGTERLVLLDPQCCN